MKFQEKWNIYTVSKNIIPYKGKEVSPREKLGKDSSLQNLAKNKTYLHHLPLSDALTGDIWLLGIFPSYT